MRAQVSLTSFDDATKTETGYRAESKSTKNVNL
jgi:hypothetical protein